MPKHWRKANVTIFRKGEKDNPGNSRLVNLLKPGKAKEHLILGISFRCIKDMIVSRIHQEELLLHQLDNQLL